MKVQNKFKSGLLTIALALSLFSCTKKGQEVCKLEISGNDQMRYDKSELTVDKNKCGSVELTLKHSGNLPVSTMGHNWVLTETKDAQEVASAGLKTSLEQNYLPQDKSKILASTDMVGGGQTTTVTFSLDQISKEKDYTFFCTFPGHFALMKGKFIVQ